MAIFSKIQTNRATLSKFIKEFEVQLSSDEQLIAPRPLPKSHQNHYIAYVRVTENSANHLRAKNFNKYSELSEEEFSDSVNKITHYWSVGFPTT